jgi:SpoVK/Ycf46/Vps4 family AAA+-type ATPase
MTQLNTTPITAREVLWTYRGVSEESSEKDFYAALEQAVAAEIAQRFSKGARIWVGREMRVQVGTYTMQARLTNVEPLLATVTDSTTEFLAQYRERTKEEGQDVSTFIAEVIRYPDEHMEIVFNSLVGLNAVKIDMARKLNLLLKPGYLEAWIENTYADNPPHLLTQVLSDRYPLIIVTGEVGCGKTALARSVGNRVARVLQTEIALFVINAQVRGGGHVGELTQNISRTFTEAERCQEREQIPVMVFIDEADALAQSRGGSQTHHEDDAGVNTLIQRIDRLRGRPMAVIFATNLVQSLDAAILRRAIASYHFDRPSDRQRAEVFWRILTNINMSQQDITQLVALTEPRVLPGFGSAPHRYTYSDLSQRIIPHAVEEAVYTQKPLSIEHFMHACNVITPTPEMQALREAVARRKTLKRR